MFRRVNAHAPTRGMTVGRGRFRIRRAASPGAGSASEGLVLQAVLLMAMVTTIGILVVAARVAGSRQSAASATLNNEARQAAEYGFSETVAEMNRDSKSYLWVTKFSAWNTVTEQNLIACGVASTIAPNSNPTPPIPGDDSKVEPPPPPIPGVGSDVKLPRSSELSYEIKDYMAPITLDSGEDTADCSSVIFGNLIGGTGEITIVGKLNRGPGSITTYTLKRTVSVNRAAPIFNNPITAKPTSRGSFNAADTRFPDFPTATAPAGIHYEITCKPKSTAEINCEEDDKLLPDQVFNSETGVNFPYTTSNPSSGFWLPSCEKKDGVIRCPIKSMRLKAGTNMMVKTSDAPVEIFLFDKLDIDPGSKLSGEDWSRFRIFGDSPGTSCSSPVITINSSPITPATTPATYESNLQNAFLWLKTGELKLDSTSPALTSTPGLVGSVCKKNLAGDAISSNLPNRKFFEGLGGAYKFQGVFGALTPGGRPGISFFYRGFGFSEQSISPPP